MSDPAHRPDVDDREDAVTSWNRMMANGAGASISVTEPSPSTEELAVEKEYDRLRIRDEAQTRLRQEKAIAGLVWPESRPTLVDELAIVEPPLPWTIDRLHPTGSNTLLTGKYKVGKTTLVANVLTSLADGVPLFGAYSVDRPTGKIGIWNGELQEAQFRSWLREMGLAHPENVAGPLHCRGYRVALEIPAVADRAVQWLGENEIDFWILDPFGKFYSGEENSNTELRRWCEAVDDIKRQSGVKDLLVVAHMGAQRFAEGEERSRGGTVLNDWADVRWMYHKDGQDRFFEAEGRDVLVPSVKLGYRNSDRRLSLAGGSRTDERLERGMQWVCEFVRDHPRAKTGEIQRNLGHGHKDDRLGWVKEAIWRDYVRTEEGRGNAILHEITDEGRRFLDLRTADGSWKEDS